MKIEEFTNEMLEELKSAKDLVKGELPELAKEYIRSRKIMYSIGLGVSFVLAGVSIALGYHAAMIHVDDGSCVGYFVGSAVFGTFAFIMGLCDTCQLLELYLAPRRSAIKAITSLKD